MKGGIEDQGVFCGQVATGPKGVLDQLSGALESFSGLQGHKGSWGYGLRCWLARNASRS